MNFEDEEIAKTKGKMYAITTLSVIGAIVLLGIMCIFSIKAFFNDLEKHKYYVIEVNDSNKDEIINLLNIEKLNYCESMYKIEYERVFTGAIFSKVYCKNEDDISLSIYNNESKLIQYIHQNGNVEKR